MITIKDVASDAGVSTATVSRVLNKDLRVSGATREKVVTSITKLRYRMHPAARTLKVGESKLIGVIAPELSNIFFMALFEYVERTLRKDGYTTVLCSSNNSVAGEIEQISYLSDRLVDGLIVIPVGSEGQHFTAVREKGIPLVFVDRSFTDVQADSVLVDNEFGAYQAVNALVRDGFTRIGFVGGDMGQMTSRERYKGYQSALRDAGLPLEEEFVSLSGMAIEGGYYGMQNLLDKKGHPDAFFFVNLMTCLGAVQLITEKPRRIQEKLVCASFDNVFYSSLLLCCRYLVDQPVEEMGTLAATMILERIRKADRDIRSVRLKTKLIDVKHKEA